MNSVSRSVNLRLVFFFATECRISLRAGRHDLLGNFFSWDDESVIEI